MGIFFKSSDEKKLESLGLDAELFKKTNLYDRLISCLKKLEGEEQQKAQEFISKVMSNQLDVVNVIDNLADSQIIIVFYTFDEHAKTGVGCLGPNARAYGIIVYSSDAYLSACLNHKDAKQGIKQMRDFLRSSFIGYTDEMKKKGKTWNMAADDLVALLGDVQFKFTVPIINLSPNNE